MKEGGQTDLTGRVVIGRFAATSAEGALGEIQLEEIDTDRFTQRFGDKAVRV